MARVSGAFRRLADRPVIIRVPTLVARARAVVDPAVSHADLEGRLITRRVA